MKTLGNLISRNTKLFFKDKGVFFSALIAPLILLFLFAAFLGDVYKDSLLEVIGEIELPDKLVNGFAGGWMISSLLAVCTVTVAFTANMIMVQDRVTGRISDLTIAPVPKSTIALAYYLSTALVTLLICMVTLGVSFIYLAAAGWYLSVSEVFLTLLDTVLLVLFGTALSSVVCYFMKSQGAITAVETIVSASYGFLCGAYMPIASLNEGLGKVLSLLPGTYGTGLLHDHLIGGALSEMSACSVSPEMITGLRDGFDCNIYFFGNLVPEWVSYLVLTVAIVVLIGIYVALCATKGKRRKK